MEITSNGKHNLEFGRFSWIASHMPEFSHLHFSIGQLQNIKVVSFGFKKSPDIEQDSFQMC